MKTFARMAIVALVIAGWPRDTHAGAVKVGITIDAQCKPVPGTMVTVKQQHDNFLEWNFTNKCGDAQTVRVCAIAAADGTPAKPWKSCTSTPDDAVPIDTQLDSAAGAHPTAKVLCTVDWSVMGNPPKKKTFCIYVANQKAGNSPQCPPSGEQCVKGKDRAPELALEVEP